MGFEAEPSVSTNRQAPNSYHQWAINIIGKGERSDPQNRCGEHMNRARIRGTNCKNFLDALFGTRNLSRGGWCF